MKIIIIKIVGLVIIFQMCLISVVLSEENKEDPLESGIENILDEFDNEDETVFSSALEETKNKSETSMIDFNGYFKLGMAYNYGHDAPANGQTDWRGLSSLKTEIFSKVKFNFSDNFKAFVSGSGFYDAAYSINNRGNYSEKVLDTYEKEFELRQAYVLGSPFKMLDIKLGRQIVVWGTSDNIRVTDVLNPLDQREPGLTDLEDLRLPLTMSRMDMYFGDISLSAIVVHEQRFDKNPPFGSDFYPLATALPKEKNRENNWDNTEWAGSLKVLFDKWDISFYQARMSNDKAHMVLLSPFHSPPTYMDHARVNMTGTAAQLVTGNWIMKAEAAYFNGLCFFNRPDKTFSRWDALLGVEYFGFNDTIISLEVVNRHINSFDTLMEQTPDYAVKDDSQAVLRISKDFLNETLTLTFLGSVFGVDAKNGSFQRYSLEYDFTDAWSLLTGFIDYQSGDKIEMKNIGKNDRVFLKLKYGF